MLRRKKKQHLRSINLEPHFTILQGSDGIGGHGRTRDDKQTENVAYALDAMGEFIDALKQHFSYSWVSFQTQALPH
ncbi:hypothetical protein QJS10_CPA08g00433 [Acorus calamus]|uniref:Uncharacterized protein n=1 Tax=Acorus calamus TaxID=4465 RepID=A0AAV9EC53_ACOCL|nr:hypothetical protein QJS10_CPA08g00433 [Acorus calamus]